MTRTSVVAVSVAFVLVAAGCAGLAARPKGADPQVRVPTEHHLDPRVEQAVARPLPQLISDSLRRQAEQMVVRVRNTSCEGVGTGSGFALDQHTLLTNRHVLAGADELEVSTWDGRTLQVSTGEVGALVDLGVATVNGTLPRAAAAYADPHANEQIAVVGFPLGGPLTIAAGRVVDFVDGAPFDIPGTVMRLTANVEPGNSGSPVIDSQGRVVGIVYETATGLGLAIPLHTLLQLIDAGGFQLIPACGSE
jgi:S1-C subfamily serine protease